MRGASGLFALLSLVVIGVIAADVIAHPQGTKVVLGGLGNFANSAFSAMLGGAKIKG